MKKYFKYTIIFVLLLSVYTWAKAETIKKIKVITDVGLNVRTGPGTNNGIIKNLSYGTIVEYASDETYSGKGCSDPWIKIYYSGDNSGYVCSSYVEDYATVETNDGTATTDCQKKMQSLGFPSSYWDDLCVIKSKYPNWVFIPEFTHLDFNAAVREQNTDRKAMIQSLNTASQGYLETNYLSYDYLADKFIVKEGSNWYNANKRTIAYYLDPRNFLDETNIFMFEKLSFSPAYQTEDAIRSVLLGTDISAKASVIYNAGSTYNVNAIYIASRIRLETGGNYANYSLAGNPAGGYAHIYNPYNIGAFTGAGDGLVWAAGNRGHLTPWTDLDTAIKGGASYISGSYIGKGQDTTYFQKFNTASYSSYTAHAHQYQTNIAAPKSEAATTYKSYRTNGMLGTVSFGFTIPVYENMPSAKSSLPPAGNPNNHLKDLAVNGKTLQGFRHDNFEYTYLVPTGLSSVNVTASVINSRAKVTGTGKTPLNGSETTITISVTAENGEVQDYKINVIGSDSAEISVDVILENMDVAISDNLILYGAGKSVESLISDVNGTSSTAVVSVSGKSSGNLATGDEITIVNNNDKKTLTVVIKGDPSGDGNIDISDLLKIQKYVLGYSDLAGSYLKAADTNNDGIVDIIDLLKIQKHILGYASIN